MENLLETTESQMESIKSQIEGRLKKFKKKDGSSNIIKLEKAYKIAEDNISKLENIIPVNSP
jgi:hypothetical protein